jgi:hypothetical protein
MSAESDPLPGRGLCPRCEHVKPVRSARGSLFLLCRLASRDERFPKYPPQPRERCLGFEQKRAGTDDPTSRDPGPSSAAAG